MGYNVDEATKYAEEDRLKREGEQQAEETKNTQLMSNKAKAIKTTAEE